MDQILSLSSSGIQFMMRKPVLWLLIFTFLHGLWYVAIVHPWQAPDEYLHYEYLRLIDAKKTLNLKAEDRTSEIQWDVAESMWLFEHYRYRNLPTLPESEFRSLPTPLGSRVFTPQPPLYYLLSLPIYWAVSSWPTLSQLYVLRVFSVLLQCLTVLMTYKLASLIFPATRQRTLVLVSAAIVATLPQYTFISASYNNDNLAPLLVAGSLYGVVRGFHDRGNGRWLVVAIACGLLSVTAKRTAAPILPILGLATVVFGFEWMRSRDMLRRVLGSIALVGSLAALAAVVGLVLFAVRIPQDLARHLRLAPDALLALANYWKNPATLAKVDWRWFLGESLESFWGQFGWLNVRLNPSLVSFIDWVSAVLAIGLAVGLWRYRRSSEALPAPSLWALIILASGLLVGFLLMVSQYLVAPASYFPQGRYLFPFVSAFAILACWAWAALWPSPRQSQALIFGWISLVLFDVYCWGFTIIPFYYS